MDSDPSSDSPDLYAESPHALIPKGTMLVPIAGIATSALALFGAWWLSRNTDDFNIMGWYLWLVFPVGAALVGAAAGSGYGIASWFRGVKITGGLLWLVIMMQGLAFVAAQYLEYTEVARINPNLGFVEYFDLVTRSMVFKVRVHGAPIGPQRPQQGIGAWGYLFRVLELTGFTLGGLAVPIALSSKPYCEQCRRYMRNKTLVLLPAGIPQKDAKKKSLAITQMRKERAAEAMQKTEQFLKCVTDRDADTMRDLVRQHAPGSAAAKKLTGHVNIGVSCCPACGNGLVRAALIAATRNGGNTTKLASVPVDAEFLQKLSDDGGQV